MRIVVVSDLHANLAALERVLADMPRYDEFYCLGDIVGYGPPSLTKSSRHLWLRIRQSP